MEARRAEITGLDPDHPLNTDLSLDEFATEDGWEVHLHDASLESFEWNVDARLVTTFRYEAPWNGHPDDRALTVRLTFGSVQILQADSEANEGVPVDKRGEVSELGWTGTDVFTLDTSELSLVFRSPQVDVTVLDDRGSDET
ncbi:hypothetical protein [Luteipulveratus mongoliensis]|uniref:Uncharacterized protein n=1 Tax=Luteipulveratus mongoliensis TaxID=571913 RepID=A0A0K1JF11_9MICO|nr:hypothetical protein [Luteipulveratus mongoliensis]AKU15178.1 hypothetical protein VV02_03735 [Luteipulveratus mongoliensis]